jgi:hypothetical protein
MGLSASQAARREARGFGGHAEVIHAHGAVLVGSAAACDDGDHRLTNTGADNLTFVAVRYNSKTVKVPPRPDNRPDEQ